MSRALTEGHRLFREWKRKQGKKNHEIAKMLGVTASQVSRWDTTTARPDVAQMAALARIAGIPESAWLTKQESRRVEKLAGRAEGTGASAPTFPVDADLASGGV